MSYEFDLQVYSLPYKTKLKQDAKFLTVTFNVNQEEEDIPETKEDPQDHRQVVQKVYKKEQRVIPLEVNPNEFFGDDKDLP